MHRPRRRRLALAAGLALVVAGCGGGRAPASSTVSNSGEDDSTRRSADPPCEPVLRALVPRVLTEDQRADLGERFTNTLIQRCDEDEWTEETLACLDDASAGPDAAACAEQLTPWQVKRLDEVMMEAFGATVDQIAGQP